MCVCVCPRHSSATHATKRYTEYPGGSRINLVFFVQWLRLEDSYSVPVIWGQRRRGKRMKDETKFQGTVSIPMLNTSVL